MKKKRVTSHLWNSGAYRKIVMIMKLTCFFMLFGLLQLSASVFSQNTKLTLSVRNLKISEVIDQIEEQSHFNFLYLDEVIDADKKLSIEMEGNVEEIIDKIFAGSNVSYRILENNLIVLTKNSSVQQKISISGIVTAGNGDPIPGANVVEKGTTNGTVTDFDGKFKLTISSDQSVLEVSFIGFVSQDVLVNGKKEIYVSLQEETIGVDEVVVVGYGTQKRSNLTGAISSVKAEDIERMNVTRVDQALRGKAAGVMINQGSGEPGSGPSIHVRGVGSIGGTAPLWIVDGIRMATGNFFDVDDIESIEVLKDASASAIYGAQAAHGVILVTTKRGKDNGKVSVDFKAIVGQNSSINLPTMLNRDQFIDVATKSRLAAGQQPDPSWSGANLPDTDWAKEIFAGSGTEQSYNLSISSGNGKANYYVSGGYDTEEGIIINNKFDRYSLRANSDFKLFNDKVKIGESLLLSRTAAQPNGGNDGIPWRSIPMMPVYDETNPFGGWGRAPTYFQGSNPLAQQYQSHVLNTNNRFNGNVYFEWEIVEGLKFRSGFGLNYTSFLGESFNEAFSYGSLTNTSNNLEYISDDDNTLTANYVLTYDKNVGKHVFKAMAGYEAVKSSSKRFGALMNDFPVDVSWSFNIATGDPNVTERSTIGATRILSQFGRFNYSYDDKYLFEASIRRDASAPKFGKENLWGVFPSFSAGWRVSQEDFLKNNPVISNLKLRLSSGTLGSDNIGSYLYSKTYYTNKDYYTFNASGTDKVPGFFLNRFPNEAVKWEEITMNDIGIDLGLFDNKLSFVIDYYEKNTSDMLYSVPLPLSVGISANAANPASVSMNIGKMKNTGFEFAVNYVETFNGLKVDISANASLMKNELVKLTEDAFINGDSEAYSGFKTGSVTRSEVGHPLSSFYGYEFVKIFDTQEEIDALNALAPDGKYQSVGTAPGDLMYRDIDGDNEITNNDKTYIGNPWPKMIYGLTTNLEWRNFDLNILFQGVQGVDLYNANKAIYQQVFADFNTSTEALNAWTPENKTNQPRLIQSDPNGNFSNASSYFVENGSYLKVRNIQLGYKLPKSLLNRLKISKARVFVNGDNLMTLTKYSGMDPEVAGGNTSRGTDFNSYPQVKTISFGVELGL